MHLITPHFLSPFESSQAHGEGHSTCNCLPNVRPAIKLYDHNSLGNVSVNRKADERWNMEISLAAVIATYNYGQSKQLKMVVGIQGLFLLLLKQLFTSYFHSILFLLLINNNSVFTRRLSCCCWMVGVDKRRTTRKSEDIASYLRPFLLSEYRITKMWFYTAYRECLFPEKVNPLSDYPDRRLIGRPEEGNRFDGFIEFYGLVMTRWMVKWWRELIYYTV